VAVSSENRGHLHAFVDGRVFFRPRAPGPDPAIAAAFTGCGCRGVIVQRAHLVEHVDLGSLHARAKRSRGCRKTNRPQATSEGNAARTLAADCWVPARNADAYHHASPLSTVFVTPQVAHDDSTRA